MEQKAFVLQNKGMNRDLSVSKAGESSAYENHNIRIVARDQDTLLSVTNEQGTKEINLGSDIKGELLGWNVLNNHVILFTHEDEEETQEITQLFAAASGVTVFGDRLEFYPDGRTGVYFRIIVQQAGTPKELKYCKLYVMPRGTYAAYPDGNWGYVYDSKTFSIGSLPADETVVREVEENVANNILRNWNHENLSNYELIFYYSINNVDYYSKINISTEDSGIDGGDSGDSGEEEEDEEIKNVSYWVRGVWTSDASKISYSVTVHNPYKRGYISFSNCEVRLKVADASAESADSGEDVHADGGSIGTITAYTGSYGNEMGLLTGVEYDNTKSYWIKFIGYVGRSSTLVETEYNKVDDSRILPPVEEDPDYMEGLQSLSVVPASIEMHVGETAKLEAWAQFGDGTRTKVIPEWSVEKRYAEVDYVTVDVNGEVTALTSGGCNVYAKFGHLTKACHIAIDYAQTDEERQQEQDALRVLESITLNESVLNMTVGGEKKMLVCTAHYSDGSGVTVTPAWRSSDTRRAVVSNEGLVVAVSEGACTIRATYGSIEMTCAVFVSDGGEVEPDKHTGIDRIYKIDYIDGDFKIVRGNYTSDGVEGTDYELNKPLFAGDLEFDLEHPIESIVYFETDDVQKIYWVDGKNVMRFMNFAATLEETNRWDNTSFDSNRMAKFNAQVSIEKDNAGNSRPNGVVQYFMTYYNLHGQQTNYVWVSDLVYLSPSGIGGAADGTNTNRVKFELTDLDTSYDHFRLYAIFRSSMNGTTVGYIVEDGKTLEGSTTAVDDGNHITTIDASEILFLGSKPVVVGTIEQKDQTLFLGDLKTIGRGKAYKEIEDAIRANMFNPDSAIDGNIWESGCIEFTYSDDFVKETPDIPYVDNDALYAYNNQLEYTSSKITTFKGGEKYRFALKFQLRDGSETEAFWIGDAENTLYPIINTNNKVIKRVVAKCKLPEAVLDKMRELGFKTAQLTIAEATYSDRSVKAQGIVNPTMFNVWERYNNRLYSIPSWITRPRGSGIANTHFDVVHNSVESTGEIECNYWDPSSIRPYPFYRYREYTSSNRRYDVDYIDYGQSVYNLINVALCFRIDKMQVMRLFGGSSYMVLFVYVAKGTATDETGLNIIKSYHFTADDANKAVYDMPKGANEVTIASGSNYEITLSCKVFSGNASLSWDAQIDKIFADYSLSMQNELGISNSRHIMTRDAVDTEFKAAEQSASLTVNNGVYFRLKSMFLGGQSRDAMENEITLIDALNGFTGTYDVRCWDGSEAVLTGDSLLGPETPAIFTKQMMFVDENIVTLNSPEIEYEAVDFDKADYKFRLVGVAKITSLLSDYTVEATAGKLTSGNLQKFNFHWNKGNGNKNGLISWPMWDEFGLQPKEGRETVDIKSRVPADYTWNTNIVTYWLHLWNHTGSISGFDDLEDGGCSNLKSKVFATMRYAYDTIYTDGGIAPFDPEEIRVFNQEESQYYELKVAGKVKYYDGCPQFPIMCPAGFKYPVLFSSNFVDSNKDFTENSESAYLRISNPIIMDFKSSRHAVISLPSSFTSNTYRQTLLPWIFEDTESANYKLPQNPTTTGANVTSGMLLPWVGEQGEGMGVPVVIDFDASYDQPVFIESDYNATKKIVTLACPYLSYEDTPWYKIWVKAVEAIGSANPVYCFVMSASRRYLIDISHMRGAKNAMTRSAFLELNKAEFIFSCDATETSGSVSPLFADYRYFEVSEGEAQQSYGGLRMVNLYTGTVRNITDYPYTKYEINQSQFAKPDGLEDDDQYLFIGEIYQEFAEGEDTRYGGITKADVEKNRFITAGPQYCVEEFPHGTYTYIYANQGDTYFQRWDSLKTKPSTSNPANGIIDITSVMLETHINLDGRTDNQRGIDKIASINIENFGKLNPVYTQKNNFLVNMDLDDEYNTDTYRSSITWTLEKHDLEDVDAWTHITLASSLKLDGDKGICRALRRYRNSLIAFQDKGISEILYNSRTQLSTDNGVPVEIANSGKVDGKRYVSNEYGCINKWSIIEGKNALYFVDNVNKMFGAASMDERGRFGVTNLSAQLGFSSWFRRNNSMDVWNPKDFNNVVSFYDKVHSDIYLVKADDKEEPCLVYNELLGAFTSFFDYGSVPMMTNVGERFVSFKFNRMWLQNEGVFCNFFGKQYGFWMQYRVTPEPYSDKIWTNVDFRADFYKYTDEDGVTMLKPYQDLSALDEEAYQDEETFDMLRIWNEYQTTENFIRRPLKKFRIWRYQIPRAVSNSGNIHGFDRIRNPWINLLLKKNYDDDSDANTHLMQMHDIVVRYFE